MLMPLLDDTVTPSAAMSEFIPALNITLMKQVWSRSRQRDTNTKALAEFAERPSLSTGPAINAWRILGRDVPCADQPSCAPYPKRRGVKPAFFRGGAVITIDGVRARQRRADGAPAAGGAAAKSTRTMASNLPSSQADDRGVDLALHAAAWRGSTPPGAAVDDPRLPSPGTRNRAGDSLLAATGAMATQSAERCRCQRSVSVDVVNPVGEKEAAF